MSGCVHGAHAVQQALERHADGTINFVTPRLLTGTGPTYMVTKGGLKDAVRELFADDAEIALLYFAGGIGERNSRIIIALRWRPKSTYTFAIRKARGSARRTRTPMAC
jgi:hypothetical protein